MNCELLVNFSDSNRISKKLAVADAFIGYHPDTAASIVMQISHTVDLDQSDVRTCSEQV